MLLFTFEVDERTLFNTLKNKVMKFSNDICRQLTCTNEWFKEKIKKRKNTAGEIEKGCEMLILSEEIL